MSQRCVVGLIAWGSICSTSCSGTDAPAPQSWEPLTEDVEGGLLLSVHDGGGDDVWVVGGRPGSTLILQGSRSSLEPLENPGEETAWWVCRAGQARLIVGESGLVLRYVDGAFEQLDLGLTSTLYGCWGTSQNDFWVVGGDPFTGPAELAHYEDGKARAPDLGALVSELPRVFFKITGTNDWLFASTNDGAVFSRSPEGEWRRDSVLPGESLFTVSAAAPDAVWVVGGQSEGVAAFYDGDTWREDSPEESPGLFGVWTGSETTLAVGHAGAIFEHDGGAWQPLESPTQEALHAVVSRNGRSLSVGGNVLEQDEDARHGVVLSQ